MTPNATGTAVDSTAVTQPPSAALVGPRRVVQHPILVAIEVLEQASASMAGGGAAWEGLEPLTIREACTRLRKVRARLDGQVMRAGRVLEAAGTAGAAGATSTGAMLASDFGGNRRETDALIRTGHTLAKAGASRTEQSLLDGSLTPDQARIISTGLLTLPQGTPAEDKTRCENALIDHARRLSLADLRRAADRAGEPILPPAETDAVENLTVQRRERRAWTLTELTMTDHGDGSTTGRFRIPHAQAVMLRTLLDAQSAPRRTHLNGHLNAPEGQAPDERENLTYPQRLGRALCALIEHVPTDGFATTGGTPAAITITMHLDSLLGGLNQTVGVLGDGSTLSAGQARRLACHHGLIPHVLGGTSLPLDRGRTARLFSASQRQALATRDHGCAFPGCDRPPPWCETHHITPYSQGGTTNLTDGVLLCARHHHLIHHDHWDIRLHPTTSLPEFKPAGHTTWRPTRRYHPGDMRQPTHHHSTSPPNRPQDNGTSPPNQANHHGDHGKTPPNRQDNHGGSPPSRANQHGGSPRPAGQRFRDRQNR